MLTTINPIKKTTKRVVEPEDGEQVVLVEQNIRDRLGYTYSRIDNIFADVGKEYAKLKYSESLKGYVKEWVLYMLSRDKSEHTVLTYLSHIKFIFAYMAKRELKLDMSVADANRFMTALPVIYASAMNKELSATSRNIALYAARSFWKHLVLSEVIAVNPFDQIEGVKEARTLPKPLTKQQYADIYNNMHEMSHMSRALDKQHIRFTEDWEILPFVLLMNSGLRTFELLNLRAQDFEVDEDRMLWLTVQGKGNKTRKVPVVDVYGLFESYFADLMKLGDTQIATFLVSRLVVGAQKPSDKVFNGVTKRMLYGLLRAVNTYPEAAKIGHNTNYTPHQFRHTYATHLLNDRGLQIEEISKLLGHVSVDTTMIYTEVKDSSIKRKLLGNQET